MISNQVVIHIKFRKYFSVDCLILLDIVDEKDAVMLVSVSISSHFFGVRFDFGVKDKRIVTLKHHFVNSQQLFFRDLCES